MKHGNHWKGGRTMEQGYVYVYVPNHPCATQTGYVLEHRLVMENHLRCYLSKYDEVHHINSDRADNRIENLVCLTRSEHRHMTTHKLSDESKKKISIANSGHNNGMYKKAMLKRERVA